jgi:hypothetical protein
MLPVERVGSYLMGHLPVSTARAHRSLTSTSGLVSAKIAWYFRSMQLEALQGAADRQGRLGALVPSDVENTRNRSEVGRIPLIVDLVEERLLLVSHPCAR